MLAGTVSRIAAVRAEVRAMRFIDIRRIGLSFVF